MSARARVLSLSPLFLFGALAAAPVAAQEPAPDAEPARQQPAPKALLKALIGRWRGTCKTWSAGRLLDESSLEGRFEELLGGRIVRHSYRGSMKAEPRTGEETIAFNAAERRFEVAWFDSFHMNYAILFSTGAPTERGFTVLGSYRMGPKQKPWGWRTEYVLESRDRLVVRAFNVTPAGQDDPAVEIVYERVPEDGR